MRLGSPDWKKLQSHPNQSNVKGKKIEKRTPISKKEQKKNRNNKKLKDQI
jgi:hypothetical protein